jgi:hypothetical protein
MPWHYLYTALLVIASLLVLLDLAGWPRLQRGFASSSRMWLVCSALVLFPATAEQLGFVSKGATIPFQALGAVGGIVIFTIHQIRAA